MSPARVMGPSCGGVTGSGPGLSARVQGRSPEAFARFSAAAAVYASFGDHLWEAIAHADAARDSAIQADRARHGALGVRAYQRAGKSVSAQALIGELGLDASVIALDDRPAV